MEVAKAQGNRLQELREAAEPKLSRAGLADRAGVGEHQVRRWEQNEVLIPTRHLPLLTALFGCSSDHLLGLDRDDTRAAA
jgi:DNA-binding transcriptional regulator YiaG